MCQGITSKGKPCKKKTEPYCSYHVGDTNKKKLSTVEKRLIKGPSKTDGPGYIYIYYLATDESDTFYKIGRTSKTVEKRLSQWKGSILKKSYYVNHQKLAERLIHMELDNVRVYRYTLEDGSRFSIWKSDGKPVAEELPEGIKLSVLTKEIEIFKTSWKDVEKKIGDLVNKVND